MKRCLSLFLSLTLCIFLIVPALAVEIPLTSHAALLMEKETGEILFAENEHEALPPASVTKIMTMLLVMEAIDDGAISTEDVVTVSAHAASMGGSQVFLSENFASARIYWSAASTAAAPLSFPAVRISSCPEIPLL